MRLTVMATDMLTRDIRLIRLARADGGPLPAYAAGAHVEVGFQLYDLPARRRYSLVSDPADPAFYDIAVRRDAQGRGGSAFLHDAMALGGTLEVGAPVNGFSLADAATRHVFIAGGIGITPLLGMALQARREGRPFSLHYAARSAQAMAFRAEVAALPMATSYFSEGEGANRLDVAALLAAHRDEAGVHIYACGPARLIDEVRRHAAALGYPARQIHHESFGPAWAPTDATVQLRLADSDIALSVPPGVTLLDAMEEAGAWIPSDCRRGECGACITGYTGGTPLHRDSCLTAEQRAHVFCPCVSWADPDTVLTVQL